ncbi:MutS2 protein [Ophiocordyceps sinensis CO18]|uniref:MutS2 protein n=1 Tax=Ophiocordyceps sinensis (strain Co18 / CGMCC 3.14243) TaxID=911162 RepID=T5AJ30_OPHSC|nr:MutS2 protein [Ophiocordyceps sinensis CO18]
MSRAPLPQGRARKTTTTVKLSDLPQGPLRPEQTTPPAEEDKQQDAPVYPTVVLQAQHNMRQFPNCVVLTRVGSFFELYFEHAEEYAPLLSIKLATKKTNAGPVPMAGFPVVQLDRFLKILVQDLNRYVAIADEFPRNAADQVKSGGLLHDRKVARIVTPGTLIDENFMDPCANNYVLAIHNFMDPCANSYVLAIHVCAQDAAPAQPLQHVRVDGISASAIPSLPLGLAWLDLSTGHFFTQAADLASLPSVLARIAPREVVLDQDFQGQKDHDIFSILADDRHLITYSPRLGLTDVADWTPLLEAEVPESTRESFTEQEVLAGSLVLDYVKDRLRGLSMKLQPPLRHEGMQIMSIDKNSMRALEIRQTIRDGFFRGSLLHAISHTATKSGARLLAEWLSAPSTSLDIINGRQDLVARFIAAVALRDFIILLLKRSHDSQRLVQKFALGRGDADDLLALSKTILATQDIVLLLMQTAAPASQESEVDCLTPLLSRFDLAQPLKLARRIKNAIDEESITHQHQADEYRASQMTALAEKVVASEGSGEDASALPKGKKKDPPSSRELYGEDNEAWIMKPAASAGLKKLHAELDRLLGDKVQLGESLRQRLGASSLTLKWTAGLGHIAHIRGNKDTRNLAEVKALSASRSTRSFHLPEWTALGQRLDQARFQIRREEQRVFQALRELVIRDLVKLRRNAAVLDELDITTSFAKLAVEQGLVRPRLNNSVGHTIMGGRHPTVEGGLLAKGRSFVGNDCFVGAPSGGLLWLITGPNMAGKSTFLRQNALITILAQIGCYVPASYAELGTVDAIFSRVGSADNLYRDQSTFMVEMLETAQILKQATPRSFVIMDEIGRGTTPEDGTAVAYACLHHLVTVNRCRTLFATHFHGVVDLAKREGLCGPNAGAVQTFCTDVKEDGKGGFVYVHKLREGVNRHSHALKVVRLAGMPERAIDVAQRVLAEGDEVDEGGKARD